MNTMSNKMSNKISQNTPDDISHYDGEKCKNPLKFHDFLIFWITGDNGR